MSDQAPDVRSMVDGPDGLLGADAETHYLFFGTIVFDESDWDRESPQAERAA